MYNSNNKHIVLHIILFCLVNLSLFGFSPATESYLVLNYTDANIKIEVQYKDDTLMPLSKIDCHENETVLTIYTLDRSGIYEIPPGGPCPYDIPQDGPAGLFLFVSFFKNNKVGILQKFLLMIDSLIIYDSEDNVVMTLDDLTEDSFQIDFGDMELPFTVTGYGLHITQEVVEVKRIKYAGIVIE